jgi:alkane 1-monooxygenase
MMASNWRWLKYVVALVIPLHTIWGFYEGGLLLLFPLFLSFLLIPFLEILIPADLSNLDALQSELEEKNPMYDGLLYLLLPLQILNLFLFLNLVGDSGVSNFDRVAMISCMGLNCGIIGINVGHELGHRTNTFEVMLAKAFLLSSLYMHFYIEHNRGHHKRVGTPIDPASARYGENLYFFLIRSIVQSYFSAWKLESKRLKKEKKSSFSFSNQMLHYSSIQLLLLLVIFSFFGKMVLLYFIIAAFLGIALLESVNYIEHYGLGRKKMEDGSFTKVKHCHSWNSNHVLGRLALFELSRHSDHHYKASKKFQLLNHHDDSPQMPTGYPGMIILALIPPLWFKVMHPIIDKEINRMPLLVKAQ